MNIYRLLYILLLLSFFNGNAQKGSFPEVLEIKSDTATYINLSPEKAQYFVEKQGKPLTLAEVQKPVNEVNFVPIKDSTFLGGTVLWVRYKIKNKTGSPLGITIPQGIRQADIYVSNDGAKWNHYITGTAVPYSKRDGYKRMREVRFTIPKDVEVMVYERDYNGFSPMGLKISVGIEKNVLENAHDNNEAYVLPIITASIMAGIFFLAFVFNIFFYTVVRERLYLMHSLLLFAMFIAYLHIPLRDFFFKENTVVPLITGFINRTFLFYLFVYTLLMILRTKKHYPKIYKVAVAGATVFLLASLYRNFFYDINFIVSTVFVIRIFLLLLLFGIIIADLFQKRSAAKLVALAIFPFILIFTFFLFTDIGVDPNEYFISFSIVWAVVTISWSLFNRYRYLQVQNAKHALDKERLAREKEEERNELIAKQNILLEQQVAQRTAALENSLAELKLTQNQLIQSEKMASLGELTAGIAHEIQNPLNFVNNFSDVSIELLQELKEEVEKGDTNEVNVIADDVMQNLEKIAHHGRRADGIVKGMLQHSRTSSGVKEPTDINALADEYLRLAYHGLRAKDKSFNAELVTDFGSSLAKANVIPQDMGRVLLNLFTNAFYATQQKTKLHTVNSSQPQLANYKPVITVSTKQVGNTVEITVTDNGTGIPDAIKDKILQPFFTTKPTGQGTGLGLSLSYDIVVKGHGGTIDILSEEGNFTTFTIKLPL
ncbi:ATP-binding protein [Flavobacterium psychrotrophum]|uniref:ATP-binding protein n=1 Tax=Flavobacterium psychrotrophum TaxID=2294119 RepID=UPI00196958C3|nr:ATP-binding protein [Flavobacterium psychrotrophum]